MPMKPPKAKGIRFKEHIGIMPKRNIWVKIVSHRLIL